VPVSKAEFDEINAGLKREGIEPIDTGAGVTAPPWSTPILIEVPPGSAEFEAILASLSEEDRAAVRPQQAPRGNGHDRQDAHQGRDQRGTGGNDDSDNDDDAVIRNYQRGEERTGAPAVYYVYYDEQGGLHQRKIRSTTKKFWQEIWKDGCWAKGAPQIKYLYGMRELLAAAPDVPIWITEGEKDRDTLAGLDLVAVTNPGGAGKWNKDFTSAQIERWFKGRKTVYLLEDNDAPGRKHVEIIGRTLQSLVADIRVVTFRELAEKSDVTDWLVEHKHTKEELLARAAAAPKYRPPALQSVNAADVTMVAVDWLWPNRFALGKLGIIAGLPDEGKGLLLSYTPRKSPMAAPGR
jgi:hypothetical protein